MRLDNTNHNKSLISTNSMREVKGKKKIIYTHICIIVFYLLVFSITDCLRLYLDKYRLSPFLMYIKSPVPQTNSLLDKL